MLPAQADKSRCLSLALPLRWRSLQRAAPTLSSNWMGFGEMTTSAWHGALQSTPVPCAVPHPCLLLSVYAGECSELIYGSLSLSVLGLGFSKGLSLNGESPLLLTPFTLGIMCRDYWFISCCELEVGHAEALRWETWDILQDQYMNKMHLQLMHEPLFLHVLTLVDILHIAQEQIGLSWGDCLHTNESSVIIYSPWCCSNAVWPFFFTPQKEI